MGALPNPGSIEVDGEPINYVNGGRRLGDGVPPIVLVHGLAGGTTWWMKNWEALCAVTEVYALDLPGFGRSPRQKPFSIQAEFSALAGWLAALKLEPVVVVGHSLGGYLSALLAARRPDQVAGLVLVDPAIFPPDYGWARLAAGLARAPFNLSFDLIPFLVQGSLTAGPASLVRAAGELLNRTILDELGGIRAQTLLLWGDADTVVPPALSADIRAAMTAPVTGPVELRGGHVAMWDDPDGFDKAVGNFLAQLRRAP